MAGSIASVLNASLAPVYVLTGISLLLSVLIARFVRIMDRVRHIRDIIHSDDLSQISMRLREVVMIKSDYILIVLSIILACVTIVSLVAAVICMFLGNDGVISFDYDHWVEILFLNALICYAISASFLMLDALIVSAIMQGTVFSYIDGFIEKRVDAETLSRSKARAESMRKQEEEEANKKREDDNKDDVEEVL